MAGLCRAYMCLASSSHRMLLKPNLGLHDSSWLTNPVTVTTSTHLKGSSRMPGQDDDTTRMRQQERFLPCVDGMSTSGHSDDGP